MGDDSIWRDFYEVADWAKVWWAYIYPIISSVDAFRVYAFAILSILTTIAARMAYDAKKTLTKLERAALNLKFPGIDPQKESTIERRKEALETRAEEELKPFRPALWKLLLGGLVIPTVTFVIVAMNYSWFDPKGLPFVSLTNHDALQTINDMTLAYFTANQFSHGALFDFLEVFNIDMTTVANNPHNYWFSGVVLIYRSLVSGFVIALMIGWAQFFYVKRSFDAKIRAEIARFGTAAPSHTKTISAPAIAHAA